MDRTTCFKCSFLVLHKDNDSGNIYFYCTQNRRIMGRVRSARKYVQKPKPIDCVPCNPRDRKPKTKKPSLFRRFMNWITRNKGKDNKRR